MFAKLENLFEFVDQAVSSICEQHPDEVKCAPGCADCCHAVFDVSFVEAAYLASHLKEHPALIEQLKGPAQEAAVAFEQLVKSGEDVSAARIRCPLLGEDDLCLAHPFRPINCRTYGTPTSIQGKGHVCGLSGFDKDCTYPTIDLFPLQESLTGYSTELVGPEFGRRRFPVSWVILRTDFFLPRWPA